MSIKLIEELTAIKAVSGHEAPVRKYLEQKLGTYTNEISGDNLGGIIAKMAGNKPGKNVAVVAHMDEVGMLVKNITDRGLIKIANVGGLVPESLICQHVELINRAGKEFAGAVMGVSPHNNKGDKVTLDDILIDFGFSSKEEVLAAGINLGDQIVMRSEFRELASDKIMSKALDNRLGCAVIVEMAEAFSKQDFAGNLYLCATVQEEVGLRGAQTLMHAFDEEIDYVLVVDVSPVDDTIKVDACKLSDGTLIRVKDPRMILDYTEVGVLQDLSEKYEIKAQNFFSTGGTDAAQIQVQNAGYITCALCVPGRNLHTNNSIIDMKDYYATRDLAIKYVETKLGE